MYYNIWFLYILYYIINTILYLLYKYNLRNGIISLLLLLYLLAVFGGLMQAIFIYNRCFHLYTFSMYL